MSFGVSQKGPVTNGKESPAFPQPVELTKFFTALKNALLNIEFLNHGKWSQREIAPTILSSFCGMHMYLLNKSVTGGIVKYIEESRSHFASRFNAGMLQPR